MKLQRVAWLALSFSLVVFATACQSSPASGAPVATATAGAPTSSAPASGATSGSTIDLHEAPANLGCDTIGVDYKSMTFHIDPAASEQVAATTDTGVTLVTYWSVGFVPGTDSERVIRDPAGKVVVTDGEVLQVPPAAYPRLAGYFVCLGTDKIYVLLNDPS
jgi:hypothetical protein